MKEKVIFETLQTQKKRLEDMGYRVAYIALQGSQNYGLDLYTDEYQSDIDLKAVIIPTLDDLVYNSKPVSTTLFHENGQIDLKDIRAYIDTLVKANPSYVEILYTKYNIIDDFFKDEFNRIILLRDSLVYELRGQFVKAIYGMIKEKEAAMCHLYPSTEEKIKKYGFDGKQTSHCIRLHKLMLDYFVGNKPLEVCFCPNEPYRSLIMEHKLNKISIETAKFDVKCHIESASKLRTQVLDSIDESKIGYSVKNEVINLSRQIIKNNIVNQIVNNKG